MEEIAGFYNSLPLPSWIVMWFHPTFNKNAVFANLVKTGGLFDIKNQSEWQYPYGITDAEKQMTPFMRYNGRLWTSEQLGNYFYGYLGAAYGYGLEFLSFGAGVYQIASGGSDWSYYSGYFDEPMDNYYITMGWNAYWSDYRN